MNGYRPPLPEFPSVPTVPMAPSSRRALVEALQTCKRMLRYREVQNYALKGYAILWIHMVLERGLDPRKVVTTGSANHRAVLSPFLQAAAAIGVHDRGVLEQNIVQISTSGARLWCQAKDGQAAAFMPLPGLGFPLSMEVQK